jgi:uncharacterized protein (DUF58 family)
VFSWHPRARHDNDSARPLFDDDVKRKLEVLSLVARKQQPGQTRAERRTRKSGFGVEFADHRPYSPGDDFRFLDWKAYARSDRLLVKQFEEEEDLTVHLLLDCSRSMGLGEPSKLNYGRLVAAGLGYVALASLDRVSIQGYGATLGPRLPPTRGKARALRMLRFLDDLRPTAGTDSALCMRRFVARQQRRGLAIVITDGYDDEGLFTGLNSLRYAKFEVAVLQIVDPADGTPKLRGDLQILDAETGHARDVTVTAALLERFRVAYEAHQRALSNFCRDKQLPYFALPTTTPFDAAVLTVLRRGGVVR